MKINDESNSNQPNIINNNPPENQIPYNIENNNEQNNNNNYLNKEDDMDDSDNLKYKDFTPQNSGPFINQRLDSTDSPIAAQYKFSIDMPNVSKQRLHEYLNNDLLNALDVSPSISKLNSGLNPNIPQNNEINDNNNPNNLYGFSLYPQANNQNIINQNNNFQNQYINNNNFNFGKDINFNYNYSNDNPNYYQNYNNNFQNLSYNINTNAKEFIPTKLRMNDQNNNNKKENQTNPKNKFSSGNKKNKQKGKKYFEVREGDWRCNQCNNLNFSFRNKCNRCNLPKELSQSLEPFNPEMINQNQQQFQMMNNMNNPNFVQK